MDPQDAVGLIGTAVWEIVYEERDSEGLQIAINDGSSLVFTVWTDWTLIIEHRTDIAIPDYFWPPEKFSRRDIVHDAPEGGLKITSLKVGFNEKSETTRADLAIGSHRISARMFGGDIKISIC